MPLTGTLKNGQDGQFFVTCILPQFRSLEKQVVGYDIMPVKF